MVGFEQDRGGADRIARELAFVKLLAAGEPRFRSDIRHPFPSIHT